MSYGVNEFLCCLCLFFFQGLKKKKRVSWPFQLALNLNWVGSWLSSSGFITICVQSLQKWLWWAIKSYKPKDNKENDSLQFFIWTFICIQKSQTLKKTHTPAKKYVDGAASFDVLVYGKQECVLLNKMIQISCQRHKIYWKSKNKDQWYDYNWISKAVRTYWNIFCKGFLRWWVPGGTVPHYINCPLWVPDITQTYHFDAPNYWN